MNALVENIKPHHIFESRPGKVGPVGITTVKTRFRQSTPTMPWAYDPSYSDKDWNLLGSNIQDGDTLGYANQGGPARTSYQAWGGNRSNKHQYGWTYSAVQSPDKATEPYVASLGDFSWRTKVARVRNLKRNGYLFSVKPYGYQSQNPLLNRGGSVPQTTTLGGDIVDDPDSRYPPANLAGEKPINSTRSGPSPFGRQEQDTQDARTGLGNFSF